MAGLCSFDVSSNLTSLTVLTEPPSLFFALLSYLSVLKALIVVSGLRHWHYQETFVCPHYFSTTNQIPIRNRA